MIGDIWRIAIISTVNGQENVNTFHYQTTFEDVPQTPQQQSDTLADAMELEVTLNYVQLIAQTDTIDKIVVRGITHPTIGTENILGVNGSNVGDLLPAQSALVVSKSTAKIGRSYRGRNYYPSGTESQQSDGFWSAARVLAVETFASAVVALFPQDFTVIFGEVVYSKTLELATPLVALAVKSAVKTIRGRSR